MLDIFEIWISHIFKIFYPPKVNRTCIIQPTDNDGDVIVKMISNTMLLYTLEEGDVEPNGKLV